MPHFAQCVVFRLKTLWRSFTSGDIPCSWSSRVSRSLFRAACLAALAIALTAPTLAAAQNLLTDGTFNNPGGTAGTPGKVTSTNTPGWTNNIWSGTTTGYNFLYNPPYADVTSGTNQSPLPLWGADDGGIGKFTAPPGGGYFIGMDGAYEQSALSQTVNNLVVGQSYYLSFWWAAAQQYNFTGATTEQFQVAMLNGTSVLPGTGNTCGSGGVKCTGIINNPYQVFSGWNFAGFTFVATATTETLSFVAVGTPNGQPPFSLLGDVTLQVPEPSTLALFGGMCGLLAFRAYQRRRG